MDDIIRVKDQFYIRATSSYADNRTHVLKHGEMFGVFDRYGDIQPVGTGEQGIFYEGTRYLSRYALLLEDQARPLLLSSSVKEDNSRLRADLTNYDLPLSGAGAATRGAVHLLRSKILWQGTCYDRIRVRNFSDEPIRLQLEVHFSADYTDLFEVRGIRRRRWGKRFEPEADKSGVTLGCRGLDGVLRRTRVECSPAPARVEGSRMVLDVKLRPHGERLYTVRIRCLAGPSPAKPASYEAARKKSAGSLEEGLARFSRLHSSNAAFNAWLNRSLSDLCMMVTNTRHGPFPYAGIPWFSAPFGRDALLSALECLWINPEMARGTLKLLAATQARRADPARDAEPGKILHEMRRGEMAALREIPFGQYYGSVDATPLFIVLAGAYYRRTGDLAFARSLWPHIERALHWIDKYGDKDGDGFVEYESQGMGGLVNQGWKDSFDAVFHEDGRLAKGPIALCEVQGYVYAAKRAAAFLAAALGRRNTAGRLLKQARSLREKFDRVFWSGQLALYALALDGRKRLCRVRTSNAGHCLWSGISAPERARRVCASLLEDRFFSGWGVRTVAAGEARYNPMSYHNGSVWPHDNAVLAAGFSRYGFREPVIRVFTGLFETSQSLTLHRLPELICGFSRQAGEDPTLYPVACSPQAWSAGAVFWLLQSCLGLSVDAVLKKVRFDHPLFPEWLQQLELRELRVGTAVLDLQLERHPLGVSARVLRKHGEVGLEVIT